MLRRRNRVFAQVAPLGRCARQPVSGTREHRVTEYEANTRVCVVVAGDGLGAAHLRVVLLDLLEVGCGEVWQIPGEPTVEARKT